MTAVILGALLFAVGVPLVTIAIGYWSEHPVRRAPRVSRDSTAQAALIAGALWVVLTAIGIWLAIIVDYYPAVITDKAEEIADAFRILMIFTVPVFSMVVAILVYGMIRRGYDEVPEDGPPLQGKGGVPVGWFFVTSALTAVLIVFPGLTSLHAVLKSEDNPELVVHVEGVQWTWLISYPELGITNVRELMLPVDRTVRFEITSQDVLHSFWVPAFLMKVDAVPGLITTLSLKPTEIGSFDTDPTIRIQCAELCGTSHGTMSIPVAVVSGGDFDAWVAENAKPAPAARGNETSSVDPALLGIVSTKVVS